MHQSPAACPAAAVLPDQPQTLPQLGAGQMNPAVSDAAPEAAPTPAWNEDMVVVGTETHQIKKCRGIKFMLTGLCQVGAVC